MVRKILLCTDGSEGSLKAAHYTADFARPLQAEVLLVSIFNPPIGASLWTQEILAMDLEDRLDTGETVKERLTKAAAVILTEARISFRIYVATGDPVHEIIELAKNEQSDMIVVGSRGLGGFGSLLLGSVADSIAHHAPCPVLIVR